MPITGELDLHSFRPQDLGGLIPDYIEACREKGIYKLRIVHGKGIGNVRREIRYSKDRRSRREIRRKACVPTPYRCPLRVAEKEIALGSRCHFLALVRICVATTAPKS